MKLLMKQKKGLGNQLFQYAAGLYLARHYNASLTVLREPDHLAVSFGQPRAFLLSRFSIQAEVRDWTPRDRLMCSTAPSKRPVAALARAVTRTEVFRQDYLTDRIFVPTLPLSDRTEVAYLEGFFQAYPYAEAVEEQLRSELRFRNAPSSENLVLLDQIKASETAVSLHMRRGDYTVIYGGRDALPIRYYENCIEAVHEHVAKPTFFIFSDDIAYARENLPQSERLVFVEHNDQLNAHEDLRLMSACRHHIIANSTFSWWGAWLNPDPAKRVYAPDRWLDPAVPYTDLMPPSWRCISTH